VWIKLVELEGFEPSTS